MDTIRIVDLEVFARHGVLPEENVLGQKFLVSVDMRLNALSACETDALEDTVNYSEVCRLIDRTMRESTFDLIERAVQAVADAILAEHPLVESVRVELKKPWAPIGLPVSYVSIIIERSRS